MNFCFFWRLRAIANGRTRAPLRSTGAQVIGPLCESWGTRGRPPRIESDDAIQKTIINHFPPTTTTMSYVVRPFPAPARPLRAACRLPHTTPRRARPRVAPRPPRGPRQADFVFGQKKGGNTFPLFPPWHPQTFGAACPRAPCAPTSGPRARSSARRNPKKEAVKR